MKADKSVRIIDISKMSKSVQELNPELRTGNRCGTAWNAPLSPKSTIVTAKPLPKERKPNKTEARFQAWWDRMHDRSPLDFEPITLRIGRRRYTPDFFIMLQQPTFYEIKGPYIREDASLKFDLFKSYFTEFKFEMWREIDGAWKRIR